MKYLNYKERKKKLNYKYLNKYKLDVLKLIVRKLVNYYLENINNYINY